MTNANDTASPRTEVRETRDQDGLLRTRVSEKGGLTKREYFAAMAMQGLAGYVDDDQYKPAVIASTSVQLADALIEALNK